MIAGVFTTGQVAKICKVSNRLVHRWCDEGLLPCYRLPASRDRRILLEDLRTFMADHRIPIKSLDAYLAKGVNK